MIRLPGNTPINFLKNVAITLKNGLRKSLSSSNEKSQRRYPKSKTLLFRSAPHKDNKKILNKKTSSVKFVCAI